jgi:hypothetical protein
MLVSKYENFVCKNDLIMILFYVVAWTMNGIVCMSEL